MYPLALRCAIQLNDMELVQEVFSNCKDPAVQKQLAFILGRQVNERTLSKNVSQRWFNRVRTTENPTYFFPPPIDEHNFRQQVHLPHFASFGKPKRAKLG